MGAPSTTKTEIAVRGHRTAAESTRHSGGSDEHDSEEEPAEEGTHSKSSQTQSGPVHCTRARAKGSGERTAWCCSLSSSGNHNAAVSKVFTEATTIARCARFRTKADLNPSSFDETRQAGVSQIVVSVNGRMSSSGQPTLFS